MPPAGVIEFIGEVCFLVQIEVAEDRDDGLDQIRLARAVWANDSMTFKLTLLAIHIKCGSGERDLKVSQIAEALNLEPFQPH